MEIFLVYRGIFRRDEEEISIAVSFLDRLHAKPRQEIIR